MFGSISANPKVVSVPQSLEVKWLAGLLEGEGYFGISHNGLSPVIKVKMADKDIIERAAELWGSVVRDAIDSSRKLHWKPQYYTEIGSSNAVGWMFMLYPFLGERRKAKIREVIVEWKKHKSISKRIWNKLLKKEGTKMPDSISSDVCSAHPHYKGLRKPRAGATVFEGKALVCHLCQHIYDSNRERGVRETRNRHKTYNEIVEENL